jgi:hypothetical protein
VFYSNDHADARLRATNTFKSSVFACATSSQINRKILGGESKGTETLFGRDDTKYGTSSNNEQIQRPQTAKHEYHQIDRRDLVAKEFHGDTAEALLNNKRDGALMASGIDWKNSSTRAIESPSPLKTQGLDSKSLKHQNL